MTLSESLSGETISANPFEQFGKWYREHLSHALPIPENMYLATAGENGEVSVRTVLMKDYNEEGFTFYTNYRSRKARQLESNNNAAILFYWGESGRQVRIEGETRKLSREISDEYFKTRPRDSQLSAWASNQSSGVPGRQFLEKAMEEYREKFAGMAVPRPEHWGGFIVIPRMFEFWEDRPGRLHDRIVYELQGLSWRIKRLAP